MKLFTSKHCCECPPPIGSNVTRSQTVGWIELCAVKGVPGRAQNLVMMMTDTENKKKKKSGTKFWNSIDDGNYPKLWTPHEMPFGKIWKQYGVKFCFFSENEPEMQPQGFKLNRDAATTVLHSGMIFCPGLFCGDSWAVHFSYRS